MVIKSVSRPTVVLLLLTLSILSLACNFIPTDPFQSLIYSLFEDEESDQVSDHPDQSPPDEPAATELAAATEAAMPATEAAAPPSTTEAPASPAPQSVSPGTNATVIGGWYGAYCDIEVEGTFYYRWAVDLMQNPADGSYAGTIKFHNCPSGGRVLYRVSGPPQTSPIITLTGVKKDGGGDLFNSATETLEFTFDLSAGQITPNLAP